MGNLDYNYNYNDLSAETQRLRDANNGTSRGGYLDNFVKMPDGNGTVQVRILPSPGSPYVANRMHRINDRSVACRRKLQGGKWVGDCPVCDYYNWLWGQADKLAKSGHYEDSERRKAEARAIKPMERFYYNVIVRKEQQQNGDVLENVGPKVLSVGKGLHLRIMRAATGDESMEEQPLGGSQGRVFDLRLGYDLKIIKRVQKGPGQFPDYDESKFVDSTPAGDPDKVVKWMENLHDLNKLREKDIKSVEDLEYEVDVYRGIIPDTRNKSRFDDPVPANARNTAAAASYDPAASEDAPAPSRYDSPAPASRYDAAPRHEAAPEPPAAESTPLSTEDFMRRLKEL